MRPVLALLLAASCARASSGNQQDGSPYDPTDGNDGTVDASENGSGGGTGDAGNSDAGNDGGGGDAGGTVDAVDASVTVDAAISGAPLAQYASRICASWGGFGTVRPDAPAHVIGFLDDADGVADIALQAEVVILGAGAQYSLGMRTLQAYGDAGCCRRAMKVPIDYTDFIAAAQVISAGAAMWGVRISYRDLGGHTTSAVCDGAAGWRVNATPIGS